MFLTSCSVFMAAKADNPLDFTTVKKGTHKSEIENHLTNPIETYGNKDGTYTVVYEFVMGTEINMVLGHAMLDVVTFGVWEIPGTYVETKRGEKFLAYVIYNEKDIAVSISSKPIEDLSPKPAD